MAEVYEVEDVSLGARYALKLFTYARGEVEVAKACFFADLKAGKITREKAADDLRRVASPTFQEIGGG